MPRALRGPLALVALVICTTPVAAGPASYEPALTAFYEAIVRGDSKGALQYRSATVHVGLRPLGEHLSTPCRIEDLDQRIESEPQIPGRVHLRITLTLTCYGRGKQQLHRLVTLAPEAAGWRITREVSEARDLAERLASLPRDERRAMVRRLAPEMIAAVGVELLDHAEELMLNGRLESAGGLIGLIDAEAGRFGAIVAARGEVMRGKLERYRGEFDVAGATLEQALIRCQESGDLRSVALAHNELGNVYMRHAELDRAQAAFEESLRIYQQLGSRIGTANVLSGLGILTTRRGRYKDAANYYRQSWDIRKELGDKVGVARLGTNLGLLFAAQDDLGLALIHLRESAKAWQEQGNRQRFAATQMNIASIYRRQNNHRLALDLLRTSLDTFCAAGDKFNAALSLREIGSSQAAMGDWRNAIRSIYESLALSEANGFEENVPQALAELGDAYARGGLHRRALDSLLEALPLTSRDRRPAVLARIAAAFEGENEHDLALRYAQRAAAMAAELGKPAESIIAHSVAGDAYRALGNADAAGRSYLDAVKATEFLRGSTAGSERMQARALEQRIAPYQSLVDLLVARGRAGEALQFAEKAKSRVLIDVLRGGRARMSGSIAPEQRLEEQKLRDRLTAANVELATAVENPLSDAATLRHLREEVEKSRLTYEHFEALLLAAVPKSRVERGALEELSAAALERTIADDDTAIIHYAIAERALIAFVVRNVDGHTKIVAEQLPVSADEVISSALAFHDEVASRDLRFSDRAHALYDTLIAPIRSHLTGINSLIVIPDGALWGVPFEALRDEEGRYLLEQAAISYAPSIVAYDEMLRLRRQRHAGPQKLIALGNPRVERAGSRGDSGTRQALAPLPDAEKEVRQIGAIYPDAGTVIVVGAEASEARFKRDASSYDVIHLATHGVLAPDTPMYSYLLMSRSGTTEDGLLEAWEVANLDLRANLVVLSACDTARGALRQGEGVIGLSWAWFIAGTPVAVLSRWKVDSAATAQLMISFHEELRSHHRGEAAALREAALRLLKDVRYRHPYFWAGFQVIGAGRN